MYLKSIRAYGFKSFADKINIELNDNITCVVGPNGSGKSNIVDAVKWVLGEQSVKTLRGNGSMSDVIFTGSKTRKELNRASVALVFDNTDHYLKTDFEEVEVKRVVYQSGENEYFINNAKVRLKDITDLFLDTGIGNESLNIISQRKIEEIVDSKPQDRRTIFESAAKVLKYKKRKEESLRKLDKTNDNLDKLKLVIDELETSVEPLREQSEKAKKYNEFKSELENIEISLVAHDITEINDEYTKTKEQIKKLEDESVEITNENREDLANIELKKLEIIKLEEQINIKNKELLDLTESLSNLQSEKQITLERQKFDISSDDIKNNLIILKEEELSLQKSIDILTKEMDSLDEKIKKQINDLSNLEEDETLKKVKRNNLSSKLNDMIATNFSNKSKKEVLEKMIENDSKLPSSIRNILSNPRLKGIHNTIYKLIDSSDKYLEAIDISLGASGNFLVVDDEKCAKKAIEYLKENKLGRATFFPLNIIKEKNIDYETRTKINNIDGYIGTMDELVKYDSMYSNIIKNQLGNIICVDNLDIANDIGKKINYKYRIVTLDGDIIHSGGSLTGGSKKSTNNILKDKEELSILIKSISTTEEKIKDSQEKLKELDKELNNLKISEEQINREIINLKESYDVKSKKMMELKNSLRLKKEEIEGNKDLSDNKIDDKLNIILENVSKLSSKKDIVVLEINDFKSKKQELNEEVELLDNNYKKVATSYNKLQSEIKEKEILIGKYEIKLDNLLLNLTENYNISYEKAKNDYPLEIEEYIARDKVNYLKREIIKLGNVNLGSIEEFERVNTRYEFLKSQKEDLEKASENLLEVISEMDEIMIERFETTFEKVAEKFSNVFKTMFKGGEGKLVLTEPDDILNSGVDIVAVPPGKKLKSNSFLSGGEKTLTAIALLFAILNVNPVPFCILDEVEAALDEANVDLFGKYLKERENKSQFILITHKKKTMEYADTLYGITMQESGVSKIVSVKLEG
ncbi:MAG: hypothetical protein E7158_04610 [Firmicutes bacterium]|nr:hypothetical protein [Bacillota bacterium]